jgi:cystathionine beta-lyase/cystathionine gamma-synthase
LLQTSHGCSTHTQILEQAEVLGGSLDPHAAFLLQRGLKTLALRVGRQNTNALALATMMEGHPAVRGRRHEGGGGAGLSFLVEG